MLTAAEIEQMKRVNAQQRAMSDHARLAVRGVVPLVDDDPVGELDEDCLALLAALDELCGQERAKAFNAAAHPRNPKGSPGGGRFRSLVDRIKDAITEHKKSGGKGDPFEGFNREQLRKVAKARGIELTRGESQESIAKKLLDHHGGTESAKSKPAEKAVPKKPAAKPAKPTGFESRLAAADKDAKALDAVPITLRTGRSARLEGQLPDDWTRARHTAAADSLEEYQGGSYATINDLLRSGKTEDYVQEWVDGVDDAMSISKLPRDTVVYRGIRRPEVVFGAAWKGSDSKVGLTWRDDGFTSTTVDRRVVDDPEFSGKANEDAAIFRIVAPAGTSAIRLSDMAPPGGKITGVSEEAEVLLQRGLTYRVVADHGYDASGKRTLDVEVVPA